MAEKFKVGDRVVLHFEGVVTKITDVGDMDVECTNGDTWAVEMQDCDWTVVE